MNNRNIGLSEGLANEVERLFAEFNIIYDQFYPNDDGDYDTLWKNYFRTNGSKELTKTLHFKKIETLIFHIARS